jgi:internalin A
MENPPIIAPTTAEQSRAPCIPLGGWEAAHRIQQAHAQAAPILDLVDLGLPELPESIGQLHHLRELYLSGNRLSSVPDSIGQMTHLKEMDLSRNQLASVPDSLGRLDELQELDLSYNQLTSVPDSLGELKSLWNLRLQYNQLKSLPASFGQLRQLGKLNIKGNHLTSLPASFGQLKRLWKLDISDNRITSLPGVIGQLKLLRDLDISCNKLASLPEAFGHLGQLQKVYLFHNRLSCLPDLLGNLASLEELELSHNPLTSLPRSLRRLSHLKKLFLHHNKCLGIPPEVLGATSDDVRRQGATPADPSAILRYYFQVCAGKRPLNEVKLILMGRGGVGKTSLVERLVRNRFVPDSAKTEGIQITPWHVTIAGERVRLHVWDFGGQEIMHATHQFFLSERSLYLVVLSGREGSEDEDAEYWLKLASSFGAGSPVIVVLNKMNEHRFDVNRRAL